MTDDMQTQTMTEYELTKLQKVKSLCRKSPLIDAFFRLFKFHLPIMKMNHAQIYNTTVFMKDILSGGEIDLEYIILIPPKNDIIIGSY